MLTFLAFAVAVVLILLLPLALLCDLFPRWAGAVWATRPGPRRHTGLPGPASPGPAAQGHLWESPSSSDTCDRCSAAAVAAVYLGSGRLLLCGHHGRQYQAVLERQGAVIVGDLWFGSRRGTVVVKPSA